jgi:hypothetical protein
MTLRTTWLSQLNYLQDAKILGIFFALILLSFLPVRAFRKAKVSRSLRTLHLYGAISGILCLFVPTAWILHQYITGHYPYSRIWALVPILPLTAALLTEGILSIGREQADAPKAQKKRYTAAAVIGCCFLLLCGNVGTTAVEEITFSSDPAEFEEVERVIDSLADADAIIYAPAALTEYLHRTEAPHRTLYGRDMWDYTLQGFRYDTYSEEVSALYQTMTEVELYTVAEITGDYKEKGILCFEEAKDADVSVLVFPRDDASLDGYMQEMAEEESLNVTVSDSASSDSFGFYVLTR